MNVPKQGSPAFMFMNSTATDYLSSVTKNKGRIKAVTKQKLRDFWGQNRL
jgi:hypothetical protein